MSCSETFLVRVSFRSKTSRLLSAWGEIRQSVCRSIFTTVPQYIYHRNPDKSVLLYFYYSAIVYLLQKSCKVCAIVYLLHTYSHYREHFFSEALHWTYYMYAYTYTHIISLSLFPLYRVYTLDTDTRATESMALRVVALKKLRLM